MTFEIEILGNGWRASRDVIVKSYAEAKESAINLLSEMNGKGYRLQPKYDCTLFGGCCLFGGES